MRNDCLLSVTLMSALCCCVATDAQDDISKSDPKAAAVMEQEFLSGTRQLTFTGRRAGEGYFNSTGTEMVFQSEREPGNPFYQIYTIDLETGDLDRISPGYGKTTCAWIHPSGDRVLFASTHGDPQARDKQTAELEMRASGKERRYAWDYDPQYELYAHDRESGDMARLTNAEGYDAEGSYSPDGKKIVFASNRAAYAESMTDRQAELFKIDPAVMIDLYIANADGTDVRRLTDTLGYDGGPFFSPDGKRICFRRFAENGATAEVMSMNIDGSDVRQLTKMNAMSWAPYYHPSGDYLIFTTNKHGFGNFELYLIDVAGKSKPVRVTYTDGFDGLPVFSPDGTQLAWTSTRTASGNSQIHFAKWNDAKARDLLGIGDRSASDTLVAEVLGREAAGGTSPGFEPTDIMRHVDYLCRKELGGRLTGTEGERAATAYVAAYMENLGLLPAGADGTFFQPFEFTAGVELGKDNAMTVGTEPFEVDRDWRPLAFSSTGSFEPAPIVFAGYGVVAPAGEGVEEYDSYMHLDVENKWVMVLRHLPADVSPETRQHWSAYSSLRYKAMVARDRGARGIIVVSGPTSKVRQQLVPLRFDGSLSGTSIGVISVTDRVAAQLLTEADKSLAVVQKSLDAGEPQMGFEVGKAKMAMKISIRKQQRIGRNVIGRLQIGKTPTADAILIGAHIDHLGTGASGNSLARDDERNGIHVGADDNASGVAAMMEVAQFMSEMRRTGKLNAQRDVLFAAWSGEELGLLGSDAFADAFYDLYPHVLAAMSHGHGHGHAHGAGHAHDAGHAHGAGHESVKPEQVKHAAHGDEKKEAAGKGDPVKHASGPAKHASGPAKPHGVTKSPASTAKHGDQAKHGDADHGEKADDVDATDPHADPHAAPAIAGPLPLYPAIAACLNMDMVGRLREKLVLQGIGSSPVWSGEIERRNAPIGIPLTLQSDSYLPTDASTFYMRGVPILSAFTGSHGEYHTPRDTPSTLNYEGAAQVANLMGLIGRSLAASEAAPEYAKQAAPKKQGRARMRAFLGTIPDYAAGDVKGVLLSGASEGGPAAKGGVKGGDLIIRLAGRKIENIYDYTYAIEALKIGEEVEMIVRRGGKELKLKVTPGSRE